MSQQKVADSCEQGSSPQSNEILSFKRVGTTDCTDSLTDSQQWSMHGSKSNDLLAPTALLSSIAGSPASLFKEEQAC